MRCEEFPRLSMAYLDGEMEAEERVRFEEHIARCDTCRVELEKLRRVKEVTVRMRLADLEEKEWEVYGARVYNRLERGLGWIFLSLGAVVVLFYGLYQWVTTLWADASLPLVVRLGILSVLLGFVILLVSVARQRYFAWRRDPYRGVQR